MAAKPASDDIKTFEKRALIELRVILQDAISSNILLNLSIQSSHKNRTRVADSSPGRDLEDLSDLKLWEVPLQPGKQHESTNTILLKFLRANEYKPLEALEMIQKTLRWRKEFGVDKLANEESEVDDFKGAMYTTGIDKEGRPVIYNVYEVFKERALNRKGYVNEETREKFMRARIQFLEKEIKQLSFKPGGIGSVLQVIDLKDSSIASMRQLRDTVKNFSSIVDDNYPELIEQHVSPIQTLSLMFNTKLMGCFNLISYRFFLISNYDFQELLCAYNRLSSILESSPNSPNLYSCLSQILSRASQVQNI